MRTKVLTLVGGAALIGALLIPALVLAGSATPNLKAALTGEQVVPAGTGAPKGEGFAKVEVRPSKHKVCFKVSFKKIGNTDGLTGGIYEGKKGENGNLDVKLFSGKQTSPVEDCVKGQSTSELKHIKRHPRLHHVNVKTAKYNQGGAIRGQLKPRD
jgi:CHRD domain